MRLVLVFWLITAALATAAIIVRAPSGGGGASFDYEESYDDATDYDLAGWSETGTPEPNVSDPDTTGPFTNECLRLDGNPDEVVLTVTANSTYNAFTLFRWTGTFGDGRPFILFQDSGGVELASVRSRITGGPNLQAWTSGGTAQQGSFTVSADTSYYIWADYTAGSGTDATLNVYISSTSTKPGAVDCSSSDGTSTADIAQMKLDSGANNYDTLFDKTIFDTASIGSDPWP